MSKVESFYWNKINSKGCCFELEQFYDLCFVFVVRGGGGGGGAALIKSSIYDYCVVGQKEFARKVGMSKVESFYWNILSSKSCSSVPEQNLDLCFVLVVQGGCTDNIQYILLLCCNTKGTFQESWNEQSQIFLLE